MTPTKAGPTLRYQAQAAAGRPAPGLHLVPVTFRQAREFVAAHHRHHGPPQGMKFAIGVATADSVLAGVVIAGRPVARHLDDGFTIEVTRTCTRGAANACSVLYSAAWQAARAMGYRRAITYTQAGETGASLRAAGWRPAADRPPAPGWNRPGRPRRPAASDHTARTRWQAPPPSPRRMRPSNPGTRRTPSRSRPLPGPERTCLSARGRPPPHSSPAR